MTKRRMIAAGLAVCLLAVGPASAQDRKDILQAIPGDAIGFVVVNQLDRVSAKVVKLGGKLKLPILVAPLQLGKVALGIDKGLDEKGTIAAVALPGGGDDHPNGVLLVPVTDYKEFIGNFKPKQAEDKISEITVMAKTFYAGEKSGYAVLVDEDGGGKETLKKVLASTTNIKASVKGVEKWLADNDVTGVLTSSGLKLIITKTREGLDQGKNLLGNLPGLESLNDVFEGIDRFLKSAETEVTHVVAGGRIDAALNLELSTRVVFAKNGKFADEGAKVTGLPGGPLAGLPGGPFVVAGGGALPEKLMLDMSRFSLNILKLVAKDLGEEPFKKLEDAYQQMFKGLRGMAMELRVGKQGQPLLHNIVGATTVADAAAYLAGSERAVRATNELFKDANIPFYKPVEIKKVKVGEMHALETISDLSDNPGMALIPQPLLELFFGKEAKIITSMAPAGKERVMTRYAPASALKKLVDTSTPGLAEDAAVAKTAALLPEGHQWALYISPRGVHETVKQVKAALDQKADAPPFPDTPPLGIGVKISAAGLDSRMVVPVQVLEGVGTLVPHLMKKFMAPAE
jgi:hypothetical protein